MPALRVSSSKQASHALPEAVMPELSLSANNAACSRHSGEVASETEVPKPMAATRVAISSRLFIAIAQIFQRPFRHYVG